MVLLAAYGSAHLQLVYAHVAPQQALSNQFGDELDMLHVDYAVLDHEKLVTKVELVKLEKKGTVLPQLDFSQYLRM